jgi:hypothetical protein
VLRLGDALDDMQGSLAADMQGGLAAPDRFRGEASVKSRVTPKNLLMPLPMLTVAWFCRMPLPYANGADD